MSLWKLLAIKIQPDTIFNIGSFPVSNTLLCTWITIVTLVVFFFFATRRRDLIPHGMQNFGEWAVEALLGIVQGVSGKEKGKKFFPLVATLFLFIFLSNLLDVFPGVDTVGWIDTSAIGHLSSAPWLGIFPQNYAVGGFLLFGDLSNKLIPWIRPATTDLNLNFSMAIIVVITVQCFGFYTQGPVRHLSHYFNFGTLFRAIIHFKPGELMQGVIEVFVGLLEIIDELARILSLSFRLFGNIFAGSIVLAVFAFVLPFVADIVFIPFEIFIAFVQALVFALLTLVYLEIATSSHTAHEESADIHEAEQEFARNEQGAATSAAAR